MRWSWPAWWRWPFRRTPGRAQTLIVLYSRPGCHLCSIAKDLLISRRRHFGLKITERNVDDDPKLAARYGNCVPVVLVNGKLRFRGRVEPALLDRLLRGIATAR